MTRSRMCHFFRLRDATDHPVGEFATPVRARGEVPPGEAIHDSSAGEAWSAGASWLIVVILLVFAPLAFGAVEYWAVASVEILVVALLLCWAVGGILRGQIRLELNSLVAAAVGFQIWIAAQIVFSKTLDPPATREDLLLLFCYFAVFLAVSNVSWPQRWIFNLALAIALIGSAIALFGIIQFFTWNGKLYWLRPLQYGTPFGPYVNKNDFAGLMEMTVPMAASLILSERLSRAWKVLFTFLTAMMIAATLLTFSRAGVISLCLGMAVFVFLFRKRGGSLRTVSALAGVGLLGLTIVLWAGIAPLFNRIFGAAGLAQEATYADRLHVYRDTLSIVRSHLLMGTGLGTFKWVIPTYVSRYSKYHWDQAHNDYLQALAETGCVGLAFVVWWIVGFFRSFLKTFRSAARSLGVIQLAAFCGCLSLLIHSFVDFNLQIPANALYFTVLAAMASRRTTPLVCLPI